MLMLWQCKLQPDVNRSTQYTMRSTFISNTESSYYLDSKRYLGEEMLIPVLKALSVESKVLTPGKVMFSLHNEANSFMHQFDEIYLINNSVLNNTCIIVRICCQ